MMIRLVYLIRIQLIYCAVLDGFYILPAGHGQQYIDNIRCVHICCKDHLGISAYSSLLGQCRPLSFLICCDIFCGVVPMGADMRAWRDMTGRLCAYLSGEAQGVFRLFCGLEQKLK